MLEIMKKTNCRQFWRWNREEEMSMISECLTKFRFIGIDTEFPGCLRETPKDAADDERYLNMRFNVDKTKLIQLGLTLFDIDGTVGGSWEINFCDFGEVGDASNPKSIEFLRRNGLDLEKIREEGIGIEDFFRELSWIMKPRKDMITWVTFHGSYDIAYLLKYVTGESLPVTSGRFSKAVGRILGSVYDLKVMAGRYQGLSSRLGLESLAHELGLDRVGTAHHAGSDSELTARVFAKMAQICHGVEEAEGIVYGLGHRIISHRLGQELLMMMPPTELTQLHIHNRMRMMTRCYGPPPPPPRPMFVSCVPPFGGFVWVPRVSM